MTIIRTTRFTADPAQTEEVLTRRAALIDALRAATPGPAEARLTRIDERSWLDIWRWESQADLEAAMALAPSLPEAEAAFAVAKEPTAEQGELVDER
jgi:quinol monooxygenase YgiN